MSTPETPPPATVEDAARHAAALDAIKILNSEPAPAAAPAKEETLEAPDSRTTQGVEDPVEAAKSPELDVRTQALEKRLIEVQVGLLAADVTPLPGLRGDLARLLSAHVTLDGNGEPILRESGQPANRETVLAFLGESLAALVQPPRGVPGSGSRSPAGETRGPNPNAWLEDQEVFERTKKEIRARGLK